MSSAAQAGRRSQGASRLTVEAVHEHGPQRLMRVGRRRRREGVREGARQRRLHDQLARPRDAARERVVRPAARAENRSLEPA